MDQLTPSTYFLITFFTALLLYYFVPFPLSINVSLLQFIGIGLLLIALTLNTLAFQAFQKYATPYAPFKHAKTLITTGIFAHSRNPVYLALVIIQISFGFVLNSVLFFVSSMILFTLLNHTIIPNEEKMLNESFGDEYVEYKERVGRWILL